MDPPLTLRPARVSDASAYGAHIARHLSQSGIGGELHYAPLSAVDRDEVAHACQRRWALPPTALGWGRAWLLCHTTVSGFLPGSGLRVVGHVELRGAMVASALHRAELSTGLETPYRRLGFGTALLEAALSWAAEVEELRFVDLKVFAHNRPARALYSRCGFQEVGMIHEAFVMPDGTVIDDVLLSRALPEKK